MATYEVGQTIFATYYNRDSTGALVDTGVLPTLTVTKPDASSTAGTVTKTATGTYLGSLAGTTLAGHYRLTFSGGTSNNAGLPWTDVADVWPADPRLMIPLADAKAALNMAQSVTTYDDELRLYIATVTEVIEDVTGPMLTESGHVWTASGGSTTILLPEQPTAITSITENGFTLAATDYVVNYNSGVLCRGSIISPTYWSTGLNNVVITYTVGSAIIPPNVTLAAREELRFLYQNGQQGGARPAFGDSANYEQMAYTPSGYTIPNRVAGLLSASQTSRVAWFG